jgi:N-acetylneuraminic acid mutarotase
MRTTVLNSLKAAAVLLGSAVLAQTAPPVSFSLEDRIACQAEVERVYWRHHIAAPASFEESVPASVIRGKAEDVALKSAALERFWGVSITDEQLQAELDRMAASSKAPGTLRELFVALDNDPRKAAECLARPLLVDRLIQTYYARDQRFHGELKTRVQSELARTSSSEGMKNTGGLYREVEWQKGRSEVSRPGVLSLDPEVFEARAREFRRSLGTVDGQLALNRVSALGEDDHRFYAVSVQALDDRHIRLAGVQWPKRPFHTWWSDTRRQLPLGAAFTSSTFQLPLISGSNCRDDSWKPTLQLLDPRYWHTAVWTGVEMIIFGGMNSVGTEYNDGSRYNPATDTWTLIAVKDAPSVRTQHVAVWTGREMIVFGGTGDTSGGRYNPVTDTWRPTSSINAPLGAFNATVVWTGTEMIVWGGDIGSTVNTGGRYNPTTNSWIQTPTAGAPLARAYHAAVWTGAEMIVWGGYNAGIGQVYGDGARYSPGTNLWKPVSGLNAPIARYFHTAVWTGREMIIWGGDTYPTYDASGGRYNPATNTWTPTSLVNAPSFRWMHAAAWTGKEMIIEGGSPANPAGGRYSPATDSWTATNPANAPTNGQGTSAVWTGKELILWGGLDDNFLFHNDGGRYNPSTDSWLRTTTLGVPAARGLHAAVWTGSEMIIWGGFGDWLPNTGGRYDPATDTWQPTSVTNAPVGRENTTAVWTGTEAIFWSGFPDGPGPGTGGRYNPVTDQWAPTSVVNAPMARDGHTAVWTGSEMIVFGGVGPDDNGYRYNPATDTWKLTSVLNSPGARDHHAAVWTGQEMIIWGGFIDALYPPIGGRYNPSTDQWLRLNPVGSPVTREWPLNLWTGSEMIVWGGQRLTSGVSFNDGGRYDPTTNSWKKTNMTGAPSPRVAQGVWTGTEMVLWGGRYNPLTDSWKPTTLLNAPFVRALGRWSTVWTGSQMIIWGGVIETQQGSLYCASGQPNLAPAATDDSYAVTAGKLLVVGNTAGVLTNDLDANADLLKAKAVTKPAHGALQFNSNGSFSYKPAAGFSGTDTFTYQANDGLADSNTASVTIIIH